MRARSPAVHARVALRLLPSIALLFFVCAVIRSGPINQTGGSPASPAPIPLFPMGVFEDGNLVNGDEQQFREMITALQSRGLDSVMLVNTNAERDTPLLAASDELSFNVYMSPNGDLNESWWPAEIPAEAATARAAALPIVNEWRSHPSLRGYITKDEPALCDLKKVQMITQAFQQLDTSRPAMPILIGTNRVGPIFRATRPSVLLIDVYPAGAQKDTCDFTMSGFGYRGHNFVSYTRVTSRSLPADTPLWMILQTHSFQDQLRQPTQTEVREQFWLAVGEGAKGIFWFVYSSQQGWVGLAENPALYEEVTQLARRAAPLRSLLQSLQKVENRFWVSGTGSYTPYASTLRLNDPAGGSPKYYAVAVNRDCLNAQKLTLTSFTLKGSLQDLETSTLYRLGDEISFAPGDGKIFELVTDHEQRLDP